MCGIYASVSRQGFQAPKDGLKKLLCNRGPDCNGEEQVEVGDYKNGGPYYVSLMSTVLAMREDPEAAAQPFVDSASGCSLCWNGEAWKIGRSVVAGNDGRLVFEKLLLASQNSDQSEEDLVLQVLRSISGPFAFVYLDKVKDTMYFGRDRLGRRSLLFKSDADSAFLELSSVADSRCKRWQEVEADGLYQLDLRGDSFLNSNLKGESGLCTAPHGPIYRHSWDLGSCLMVTLGMFNHAVPSHNHNLNLQTESISQLRDHLERSLRFRILNVPVPPVSRDKASVMHPVRLAILFSGGLDCTVMARMVHDILPAEQEIDLLNIAFENPRVVEAAQKAAEKDKKRMSNSEYSVEGHKTGSPFENCPDRETGRNSFEELCQICPGRTWRFVAVDIAYDVTIAHRAQVIDLIHPHNTEMDLSIAYALYFAARGSGVAITNLNTTPILYTTPARVLLSGLGADELFGGYTRHGTAFRRTGFPGLLDELKLDVDRLGKRNLGRDDRVISHWGREARFPYLDEALVKWAVECPIEQKCGFRTTYLEEEDILDIEPGKKILRLLAWKLGMHNVAKEKKRAIQFGARTAKMETGNIKGTAVIS